jgi:hypothetical protein
MKSLFKFGCNKVFIGALFLLIVLNVFGAVSEDALFLQSTKPLFVLVFLIFFYIGNRALSIPFILFLLYSFLGDSASMFFSNETFIKASSIMYFLSYLCLIYFVIPKFKFEQFNKYISFYLVFVILINIYFLYTLYGVLGNIIPDKLEVSLFILKSVSLIVLLILSFSVYLISETKLSILFLIMALSFVFSDVLNYVNQYYVYHWSFLMIDRLLHAVGLFYLFNYIMAYNKSRTLMVANTDKLSTKNILV